MKRFSPSALVALWVSTTLMPSAYAQAWAQLDVTGTVSFSHYLDSTGSSFMAKAIPYTARKGEPTTLTVNYNLRARDSGRPVTLSGAELDNYNTCNSILFFPSCPPPITPYESAFTRLSLYWPHEWIPPFLDIHAAPTGGSPETGGPPEIGTQRGAEADEVSSSGTWALQLQLQDWAPVTEFSGVIPIISSQWVVTSPVPEPATVALMMAGLATVGLRRRVAPRLAQPLSC